jgi:hypothetical protein
VNFGLIYIRQGFLLFFFFFCTNFIKQTFTLAKGDRPPVGEILAKTATTAFPEAYYREEAPNAAKYDSAGLVWKFSRYICAMLSKTIETKTKNDVSAER